MRQSRGLVRGNDIRRQFLMCNGLGALDYVPPAESDMLCCRFGCTDDARLK